MPALRDVLGASGFGSVRTYVQSGNIVLDSELPADEVAERVIGLIAGEFGLDIPVVTRTRDDLARILAANPLAEGAEDPKRYQVTFLSGPLSPEAVQRLETLATARERLVVHEREVYSWHAEGVARSKLSSALAGGLGVVATARNWTTVTTLLQMASG
jgi:uncharacterized protein (DUF1697 family)